MNTLFSYNGRLNRKPYFWYWVLLWVIEIVVSAIVAWANSGLVSVIALIIYALCIIFGSFLVVKRFHDIGKPGWYFWLLIIPLYNIYLVILLYFQKGTAGSNAYGADPLGQAPAVAAS